MGTIVITGDLYRVEVIRFLKVYHDYENNMEVQPIVVNVPPKTLKKEGINLEDVGVNQYGKREKGGAYYLLETSPWMITDPYMLGEHTIYVIFSGIKFRETNLTKMFTKYQNKINRLIADRHSYMAEIAKYQMDLKKLKEENLALLKAYSEASAVIGKTEDKADEDEDEE